MKKTSLINRSWLDLKVYFQKGLFGFKKSWRQMTKLAKPFIAPKYWLLYLLSFSMGLYLFGPSRGIQQIKKVSWFEISSRKQVASIETLQRELDLIKRDLRKIKKDGKLTETVFNPQTFGRPALGEVVKGFEWIYSENAWRLHTGVDIAVPPESNILASAAGMVTEVKMISDGSYGITINHGNGWESVYTNVLQANVEEGQKVIKGVVIGLSNNSGCASPEPGFHFAIYHDKQPIDPAKIIKGLSR